MKINIYEWNCKKKINKSIKKIIQNKTYKNSKEEHQIWKQVSKIK